MHFLQIRAELAHHQIRVYPFDTEDNDDEERQLNGAIRVCSIALSRQHRGLTASATRRV